MAPFLFRGLHMLLTVCILFNLCKATGTYVHVAFDTIPSLTLGEWLGGSRDEDELALCVAVVADLVGLNGAIEGKRLELDHELAFFQQLRRLG